MSSPAIEVTVTPEVTEVTVETVPAPVTEVTVEQPAPTEVTVEQPGGVDVTVEVTPAAPVEVTLAPFGPQGIPGPPGVPGPKGDKGDKGDPGGTNYYRHVQPTTAATWRITHNLGMRPSVTVVDSAGTVILGDPRYLDDMTVEVDFAVAFSGEAYLS